MPRPSIMHVRNAVACSCATQAGRVDHDLPSPKFQKRVGHRPKMTVTSDRSYPFDADVYDQIAGRSSDVPFWCEVVKQIHGSVLELGVGTGRLATALCGL